MRHSLDSVAKAHGRPGKVKRSALADTKDKPELTAQESRALGSYCEDDVNDTYGIFWDMYDFIPDDEMELIDKTARMFCDPVLLIDIPRVQKELEKEIGGKVASRLITGATVEELMSTNKFAALLTQAGAKLPFKTSPSTGKAIYAFAKSDEGFQTLIKQGTPNIKALCEARLRIRSTIGETRAVRFLEAGKDGMKLPVLLNFSGAHTHRWSGGNKMNLQNLVRGGELRRSILAPAGYHIVVADSAQIEARVLAWLAHQTAIVQAFADGTDVYKMMAAGIFGISVSKVTPQQRFIGKVCVLGLGFGMGGHRLAQTLRQGIMGPAVDISEEECTAIVNSYRTTNHNIKALWKIMDNIIVSMLSGHAGTYGPITYGKGYIALPNGLFLQYYGLHGEIVDSYSGPTIEDMSYLTRNGRAKLYGGLLTENVVQALARCIIAEQMLTISRRYRIVTMSHDEIVAIAKIKDAENCLKFMLETMATSPAWAKGLPLAAEGGHDVCYSK
jgi:DNA polymerase